MESYLKRYDSLFQMQVVKYYPLNPLKKLEMHFEVVIVVGGISIPSCIFFSFPAHTQFENCIKAMSALNQLPWELHIPSQVGKKRHIRIKHFLGWSNVFILQWLRPSRRAMRSPMRCLHGLAKRSDQRLCHEKRVIGRGLSVTQLS